MLLRATQLRRFPILGLTILFCHGFGNNLIWGAGAHRYVAPEPIHGSVVRTPFKTFVFLENMSNSAIRIHIRGIWMYTGAYISVMESCGYIRRHTVVQSPDRNWLCMNRSRNYPPHPMPIIPAPRADNPAWGCEWGERRMGMLPCWI